MPTDLFWYGSPEFLWAYQKSYEKKRDLESKERSTVLDVATWAIGIYVTEAIGSTFGKSKYPSTPKRIFREPETKEEMQKRIVAQITATMENCASTLRAKEIAQKAQSNQ